MKVSLFITCLTDLFAPEVGLAVVKVLEHFGCEVDFPADQTCCGQPQFNNGYSEQTVPLARRMIEVFQASEYVVSPSGSCCAMLREHYLHLLHDDPIWLPRAEALAAKTFEFVEFLTKVLEVDVRNLALPRPTTSTYHYTCHLRGLGMTAEPALGLLRQMQNSSVAPLEKLDQCCGFGGTFAAKYPEISGAIVREKVACGNKTGAEVMVVNDAGCAMNIGGACHRHGGKFQVKHLAQLLLEAIENGGPTSSAPRLAGGAA